jgi:hypothetical protein
MEDFIIICSGQVESGKALDCTIRLRLAAYIYATNINLNTFHSFMKEKCLA